MTKSIVRDPIYRRWRFDAEIIQLCVRWYIKAPGPSTLMTEEIARALGGSRNEIYRMLQVLENQCIANLLVPVMGIIRQTLTRPHPAGQPIASVNGFSPHFIR